VTTKSWRHAFDLALDGGQRILRTTVSGSCERSWRGLSWGR